MTSSEFLATYNKGGEERINLLSGLAALILSASEDLPEDVMDQDAEFDIALKYLELSDVEHLVPMAREVNLIED